MWKQQWNRNITGSIRQWNGCKKRQNTQRES